MTGATNFTAHLRAPRAPDGWAPRPHPSVWGRYMRPYAARVLCRRRTCRAALERRTYYTGPGAAAGHRMGILPGCRSYVRASRMSSVWPHTPRARLCICALWPRRPSQTLYLPGTAPVRGRRAWIRPCRDTMPCPEGREALRRRGHAYLECMIWPMSFGTVSALALAPTAKSADGGRNRIICTLSINRKLRAPPQ